MPTIPTASSAFTPPAAIASVLLRRPPRTATTPMGMRSMFIRLQRGRGTPRTASTMRPASPETIAHRTDCRQSFWIPRVRASRPDLKRGSDPGVNPPLVFWGRERSVDCYIRDREAIRSAARRRSARRTHGPSHRRWVLPGGKGQFPPRPQAKGGGAVDHIFLEQGEQRGKLARRSRMVRMLHEEAGHSDTVQWSEGEISRVLFRQQKLE
jgi:hypothetical protein